MKPERALELVREYASLNRQMKEYKKSIAFNLEKCSGLNGDRRDENGWFISEESYKDTHLALWFKWSKDEDSEYGGRCQYDSPDRDECEHCYFAYEVIIARKQTRKRFGIIKGIISRYGLDGVKE